MFLQFFTSLRDAQVPVTLREYLTLMEALDADLADQSVDNFYYLSRAALVKDERNLDKFDRVFGSVFKGLESLLDAMGKVVSTGPGKRLDNGKRAEMSVKNGDTVVYGKYAGTEVEIKGEKHLILRESELLGVLEG